jgi:hypothetical protein
VACHQARPMQAATRTPNSTWRVNALRESQR